MAGLLIDCKVINRSRALRDDEEEPEFERTAILIIVSYYYYFSFRPKTSNDFRFKVTLKFCYTCIDS